MGKSISLMWLILSSFCASFNLSRPRKQNHLSYGFENQKPTLPFEEDQSEDLHKDEDKDK